MTLAHRRRRINATTYCTNVHHNMIITTHAKSHPTPHASTHLEVLPIARTVLSRTDDKGNEGRSVGLEDKHGHHASLSVLPAGKERVEGTAVCLWEVHCNVATWRWPLQQRRSNNARGGLALLGVKAKVSVVQFPPQCSILSRQVHPTGGVAQLNTGVRAGGVETVASV